MILKIKIILGLLLTFSQSVISQNSCDSITIGQIFKLQIKIADNIFKQQYLLHKTSKPFTEDQNHYKADASYSIFLCERYTDWNSFFTGSKYGMIASDTTKYSENTCFISTPLFNKAKTKCRIGMRIGFGEWGGNARYYYYVKKGKNWKYVRSTLISIS